MQRLIESVQDLGVLVRATRKSAGIRIDDLAATVELSKQQVSDLELGKEGVQLGKVLKVLKELGLYVFVDMPDFAQEHLEQSNNQIVRTNERRLSRKGDADGK